MAFQVQEKVPLLFPGQDSMADDQVQPCRRRKNGGRIIVRDESQRRLRMGYACMDRRGLNSSGFGWNGSAKRKNSD
uniref:Uncharacterized protein n=1 Tax=Oryza punctata TaxID=4537 RepID=A0A0E0LYS0_ORYPU